MNNYSKQREVVLKTIQNTRTHPTAEEIYNMVIKKEETISKSTVYRNINVLVQNGEIKKITMPVGPDRYDYLYENHHHAICEVCGKVFDFDYNFDKEKISKEVLKQTGLISKIDCITINGICKECKSNKNY